MSERDDEPPASFPVLRLEVDQYMHHLDDTDLTDEEKTKLLEGLWLLVTEFMSIGFETHPAQQALAARKAKTVDRADVEQPQKRR